MTDTHTRNTNEAGEWAGKAYDAHKAAGWPIANPFRNPKLAEAWRRGFEAGRKAAES